MRLVLVSLIVLSCASAFAQNRRTAKPAPNGPPPPPPPAAEMRLAEVRSGQLISPVGEPRRVADHKSEFRWDAFVDAQLKIPNKDRAAEVADRGFTINDGALYLAKDFMSMSAHVDLPFEYAPAGNGLQFAASKAQAFINYQHGSPLFVRFGQYDTFFGVEANDSRDRFFADVGLLKLAMLPQTHTGVQLGYNVEKLTFRGQIANPADQGALGDENIEFALQGRVDAGTAYGALGLSMFNQRALPAGSTTEDKNNFLVDVNGGLSMEKMRFDGELVFKKTAGQDKSGIGLGLFSTLRLGEQLDGGVRLEYGKDITMTAGGNTGAAESVFALSLGPSYRWLPDATLRGDFSFATVKIPNADSLTIFGLTASLVADL